MKSGLPGDLSDRYGLKTFKNANFYHTEVKVMLWEEGESRIVFCGNHHFNTAPPSTALRRQIDCLTQILIKLEVLSIRRPFGLRALFGPFKLDKPARLTIKVFWFLFLIMITICKIRIRKQRGRR